MSFKKEIKVNLGKAITPLKEGIIVNSYGRSGSTMLVNAVVDSAVGEGFNVYKKMLKKTIYYPAWDMNKDKIYSGFIYKTHDYPPYSIKDNTKIVYIFSDPVDVVLSLLRLYEEKGEGWMRLHFDHLKSKYVDDFFKIISEDTLGLEKHFDSWLNEDKHPVAFLRYDELWSNEKKLADFLNIPLKLPAYRERKARNKPDPDLVEQLEKTYSGLRKKVYGAQEFFTINY